VAFEVADRNPVGRSARVPRAAVEKLVAVLVDEVMI
jgi:hypothetical protein